VSPVSDAPADEHRPISGPVGRFLASLQREDCILLVLRDQLYEGSWQEMRQDLIDRREGRPCVFKLARRIDQDIERIDRLKAFEREQGIDLADYVDLAARLGLTPEPKADERQETV
jgi:hypothetical protein